MPKEQSLSKNILNRETILYLIFGVLTTVLSIVVFWGTQKLFVLIGWQGIVHIFDDSKNYAYLDANTIAWIIAVVFAFVTNKLIVFESKSWNKKVAGREFLSFTAARLVSFGVDQLMMFLLVSVVAIDVWASDILLRIWDVPMTQKLIEFMEEYSFIAKCIVQFIIVVLNYVFSKLFIFSKKSKDTK